MTHISWPTAEKKIQEWTFAKEHLIKNGTLLPNGSKIRRKDYPELLSHSFLVIDNQILVVAEKGAYLGKGLVAHTKLAENEAGELFALKISTPRKDYTARSFIEAEIARDLGLSGQDFIRVSSFEKHYIAYHYLGRRLLDYLDENPDRSLDKCYELCIKTSLALHELHAGIKSITGQSYLHNDIHFGNLLIDDNENIHFIDFGRSRVNPDDYDYDIYCMLSLFFTPIDRRSDHGDWIFGDLLGELNIKIGSRLMQEDLSIIQEPHTIRIYADKRDKNTDGSFSSLRYVLPDLQGNYQEGIIKLSDLGLENVVLGRGFLTGREFTEENYNLIKDEVRKKAIVDGHTIDPDTISTVLLELLNNPIESSVPSALDIAETLTVCRFGLEDYHHLLKGRSPDERLEAIEVINSLSAELNGLYKQLTILRIQDNKALSILKKYFLSQLIPSLKFEHSSGDELTFWLDSPDAKHIKEPINSLTVKLELEKNKFKFRAQTRLLSKINFKRQEEQRQKEEAEQLKKEQEEQRQKEEAKQLKKEQEKQQQKLREKQQRKLETQRDIDAAERVITIYIQKIQALPVQFNNATTTELIQKQEQELLNQLADITFDKKELSQALKTLMINEQSSKINDAVSAKTEQIHSMAQQSQRKVEDMQRETQQRLQEELHAKVKSHEDTFNGLLTQLQVTIIEYLEERRDKNPEKYSNVFDKAISLQETLIDEGEQFFTFSPTPQGFERFKKNCHTAITAAEEEFKKHRDLWYQVHPIIKGILGVLAALTIIPGLVVALSSKQGYSKTFFSTPETNSQKKLATIKEELEKQEEDISQNLICSSTH